MTLSVYERLALLNILPTEGDLTTLRIVRDLREGLSFSEAEHARLQFHQHEDGRVEWARDADQSADVTVGPRALTLICDTFQALSEKQKLSFEHLAVYERFLEAVEGEKVTPLRREA